MAITKKERLDREVDRDVNRSKKMKEGKIEKKLLKAFSKLNNKNCYAFFDEEDSMTRQNLLDFLSLLEKELERRFGKSKKYSKTDVWYVLKDIIRNPTDVQEKTLIAINKHLKSTDGDGFRFKGLFKGKRFDSLDNDPDYVSGLFD